MKSWQTSQRMLGPDFWDIISQDTKIPGRLLALTRHAALRLAMVHEDPKFITVSDVRKLLSQGMQEKVHKAEELMMEARGVLFSKKLEMETPYVNEFLGWEMQCIEILLEKKDMKHLCLENALQMQIDAIQNSGGPCISTKWEEFRPDPESKMLASPGRNRNLALLVLN